jgi:ParB-like chromosome segregation protein Spo0J
VAEIAASIREFGWTNPILVDGENGIIAGHGRLLAARKLGMQDVPVIELSGLSEAQKRAPIIADNKLALNAGWDEELLALEIGDLQSLARLERRLATGRLQATDNSVSISNIALFPLTSASTRRASRSLHCTSRAK